MKYLEQSEIAQRINQIIESGDFIGAYDLCQKALTEHPMDPGVVYLSVLSLARSGATQQAFDLFHKLKSCLEESEETLSLEARIYKDQFLKSRDNDLKLELGRKARDKYLNAFEFSRHTYPGINAATLSCLIGDTAASRCLAEEILTNAEPPLNGNAKSQYHFHSSLAEACLLLERYEDATENLETARLCNSDDYGNLSTTYHQLKRVCEAKDIPLSFIEPIRPPAVITYTGQMVHGIGKTPGIDQGDIIPLQRKVRQFLKNYNIRIAYGSLACGADIIIAEETLNIGGELNITLPFSVTEFKRLSVAPGRKDWENRFDATLKKASSVSYVVESGHTGLELLYSACSMQTMGMAYLRAKMLGSRVYQVALWNGQITANPEGTYGAIQRWESLGQKNLIINVPKPATARTSGAIPPLKKEGNLDHVLSPMVFADVNKYSTLKETQYPTFYSLWINELNRMFSTYASHIYYVNTWGDAVFLVLDSIASAAEISLKLSRIFFRIKLEEAGLPGDLGLRVAAHIGPIFRSKNPFLGSQTVYGTHVNQAARLEPCTPVGSVYVTEPFAALVSLECGQDYYCEYVGNHPLPKNFGKTRIYHLQPRQETTKDLN